MTAEAMERKKGEVGMEGGGRDRGEEEVTE